MARTPLAAVVIVVAAAALPGWSQLSTESKAAVDGARKQAAGLFEKGESLDGLDLKDLASRADALGARRQIDELLAQVKRARYLQDGREAGDENEAYKNMLKTAAKDLGADGKKVLTLYGEKVRAPRLGQSPSPDELAVRGDLIERLQQSSTLTPQQKEKFAKNLKRTSEALMRLTPVVDAGNAFGDSKELTFVAYAVPGQEGRATTMDMAFSDLPPRVQHTPLHTTGTPPPATKTPLSWSSLAGVFDWGKASEIMNGVVESVNSVGRKIITKGGEVVKTIYTETSNFTGYCYRYVKKALGIAGVDTDGNGACYVGQGHAYQFAAALNKCPKLMDDMKLRPLDPTTLTGTDPSAVPPGSILVYDRGCAGFSAESGHIEVTLSKDKAPELPKRVTNRLVLRDDQVLACSDGCTGRTLAFLRTYATTTKSRKKCLNMFVPIVKS